MTSLDDWHPADVVAAVRKAGSTLAAIAQGSDLSPSTLRTALRRPQRRAEAAIAAFLQVKPRTIWPSRYDLDGHRIVTRGISTRRHRGRARGHRA